MKQIDCSRFYAYAELRRHVTRLVRSKPGWTSLHRLGKSPGGRDILMIEITDPATGPAADKPAFLVHGNVHAIEVSGSASALYLAQYLLDRAESDPEVAALLARVAFYIVPRVSVDGAEEALVLGREPRSRDELELRRNCITPQDLNGDGRILRMRIPDPNGSQVALPDEPRLLFERLPGDPEGRRYRVVTEGLIHDWDGGPWHDRVVRGLDFNRNWGFNWKPPHEQGGAGRYAFSEPEVRAVGDFVFAHPNIFGMLGFHTGPQAVLRPPSTGGDAGMSRRDVPLFRELCALGAELTGFPAKAINEYHGVFHVPLELWGHFPDWGYKALGLVTFEIELGTMWNSVGYSTEDIFKFRAEDRREVQRRMLAWHDGHPEEGLFAEWQPYDHPQLGPVEIGGFSPTGWANVAPEQRVVVWERARRFVFALASRGPRLALTGTSVEPLGGGLFRVACRVSNEGYLSTSVTNHGAGVERVDGVVVDVERTGEIAFVAGRNHLRLGQLAASRYCDLSWVVRTRGKGAALDIAAQAARCGRVSERVELTG